MLNLLSILIGLVAALLGLPAFIPGLGWAWWLILPIAAVGALIGQLSSSRSGRNFNLLLLIIGAIRLSLGGGIL